MESEWVDLEEVQALSWCSGKIDPKGQGQSGSKRLPSRPGIDPCPEVRANPEEPLCWWDGNQWVCGMV